MNPPDHPAILVVGATGRLGGVVARKLLAAGHPVRALARNATKLEPLHALGAQVIVADLLDHAAVERACAGVQQVYTSANNVMGSGATSPNRVDIPAHRNLCAAAKHAGVRRLFYVSAMGLSADSPVDYFRVKHEIEGIVRESGVPYVILRPTAFMDIWVEMILGDGIRKKGVATIFGDGRRVTNFIAVEDVAEFCVRILARDDVRNEVVEIGGRSSVTYLDVVALLEHAMGVTAKRRHVPVPLLRVGRVVARPFSEKAARMLSLGYFTTQRDEPFVNWRTEAERFGVAPRTVEAFLAERYAERQPGGRD